MMTKTTVQRTIELTRRVEHARAALRRSDAAGGNVQELRELRYAVRELAAAVEQLVKEIGA